MKKLKIIALALTISITGSAFLKAADAVKTLPPAIYQQMKHGKKLENVWVGNDYDKTKGFKVNAVEYKAEIRNGAVMDYLPKALATLAKDDSPVTLQVVVTRVTTKAFTGFGNAMGKVFVEGKISDATGKIIAAFTTSGSAGNWGDAADDFQLACDKIASGIATDLLAKSNNGLEVAIPVMPPTVASDTVNSEVLTNDSIVQLVKADMSEEILISMIKTQPTRFDVGKDGVLALKTNGVSDNIIKEMVLRGQGASTTLQARPSLPAKLNDEPEVVVPMQPTIATTNIISDPAVEKLCEALDQDNPGKVKGALNKLRDKKLKDNASQAVPKILPCLANSKPDVVREALKTLAAIGNPDAVPAILPLLTNERPDIVREACRTLAAIGNKDTIPSLEPLLMNPRSDISDEARKAITKLRAKS
jgi:hypothetical protein